MEQESKERRRTFRKTALQVLKPLNDETCIRVSECIRIYRLHNRLMDC